MVSSAQSYYEFQSKVFNFMKRPNEIEYYEMSNISLIPVYLNSYMDLYIKAEYIIRA